MTPEPTVHAWEVRGGMVAETRNGTWQTYEQEQRLKENAMTPKEQMEQMFPLADPTLKHICRMAPMGERQLDAECALCGELDQRRDTLRRVCAYIMARGCLSSSKKYMEEMAALGDLILEGLGLTAADLEGLV